MKYKILIVGAGFGQLPAITRAKELDLEIIVVDKNPEAIGMKLANYSYPIDVLDKEEILAIARKHEINGIMTMQSDLPVPTIGFVNDALGLTGVSYEVANFCSNKIETRKRLKVKQCAQPNFEIVDNLDSTRLAATSIGFPCVIKAPDSSGSRGIVKVGADSEIDFAFNEAFKYTRGKSILVEEYVVGLEFGAQTFSVNGKCEIVLLHNDTISSPPFMIPIGHSLPFTHLSDEQKDEAERDIRNAIEALGIKNGPANVDLILDNESKKVKVIEVGARIGATCLPELVTYHSGIDWVGNTIKNAMNLNVDLRFKHQKPIAALIIESPIDGLFRNYILQEGFNEKELIEYEVTPEVNEEVNILRKGTDRIGKIIAYGVDVETAERKVKYYRDLIQINVE
ncbi:ATP-grasp domain-containing protein [Albibacterium sp.]|uniref:ATP-grasp domain-containing protein n=1 Tax=Albibacterium sp. TaxID=2952885 RepID=UPI002BF88845|nr:ATP-grasp domain-containing protein [Albibacterium sp.]HUH18902.1 ATP-grasp domain-containing protein [Albibacterium sp.]